jgi:hypothetical protein
VVRWGTDTINAGTGSFNIDGTDRGYFVVPSGTIAPKIYASENNPDVLCIGNYLGKSDFYVGPVNSGVNSHKLFFSKRASEARGTYEMTASTNTSTPFSVNSYRFDQPLQAELHDLCIKKYYVTDTDVEASGSAGITDLSGVAFYLPPFFVEKSPIRKNATSEFDAGIHYGLGDAVAGTTFTPFSLHMSFGLDGHVINLENFLKDFATENFPNTFTLNKTNSFFPGAGPSKDVNSYIYKEGKLKKRNLTILPCDDGNFYPAHELLESEEKNNFFVDDNGSFAPGYISLSNLMSITSSILEPNSNEERKFLLNQSFIKSMADYPFDGSVLEPENPTRTNYANPPEKTYVNRLNEIVLSGTYEQVRDVHESAPLGTLIRTKDSSSNQVTMFDISNLYYGLNILPGSFTITDNSLSGSAGSIKITIKDDGHGTLYRSDSATTNCTWNAIGTIFYNEGIVLIKNPHLYFFGKDGFEMSFKGEQNIHVLRFDIVAPSNHLNSSSNPAFIDAPATLRPNEYDSKFVYITGINFHDDNLNVIMKTQLAQPIMKRHSDKIAFKVKYDF